MKTIRNILFAIILLAEFGLIIYTCASIPQDTSAVGGILYGLLISVEIILWVFTFFAPILFLLLKAQINDRANGR